MSWAHSSLFNVFGVPLFDNPRQANEILMRAAPPEADNDVIG